MNQTPAEKIINTFIARRPQMAIDFLKSQDVPISSAPTLNEITARLYERYYQNDKAFNTALGEVIAYGDNIGFVITTSVLIAIIGSTVSVGVTGGAAAAKLQKDKRIAENQAQVAKNAATQKTQAQLQAERDSEVASSVARYTGELEGQSTQRRKSAIIFVAGIAVVGMVAALIFRK